MSNDKKYKFISYSEIFYQHFPYYLSIGMTESQYWEGDSTLVKYYRKADEIRKERMSYEKWLQGRYIYDAISSLSPVLHAFAKKGTKAKPYINEPYPITGKMKKEENHRRDEEKFKKGLCYMQNLMAQSEIYYKERK